MNDKKLRKKLQKIARQRGDSIRKEVAEEVFNHSYNEVKDFFEDLRNNGCASGMIGKLIYYYDTHKFFNKHYSEIEDLRYEYEEMTGVTLQPQGDLMNWYAWFSFEEVARQLATELNIISL